jgi:hypothetical protein
MQRLLCKYGCCDVVHGGPVRFRNLRKYATHMDKHIPVHGNAARMEAATARAVASNKADWLKD